MDRPRLPTLKKLRQLFGSVETAFDETELWMRTACFEPGSAEEAS